MRKLVVSELVTLDGVIGAPGGEPGHPHTGWAHEYMGEEQIADKFKEALEAGSLLLGRATYESFAEGWGPRSGEFAYRMNSMPKQVVSTTLRDPQWPNSTVISHDVLGEVARLRQGEGRPILVNGSRTLVHTLIENDLVDEYRMMIFPVVVGSGFRLFPESRKKIALDLTESRVLGSVMAQTYRPVAG